MMTTEFLTEAIARAEECEGDVDYTAAPVFGVVWFDTDNSPRTIDIYAGQYTDVKIAAEWMQHKQKLARVEYVKFGRLSEPQTKAELIRQTAMQIVGY